jgi:hypothetical protein
VSSPFDNPALSYGIGLSSAAVLAYVAFTFLDGQVRWLVLGLAALEIVVVPQVLKRAA